MLEYLLARNKLVDFYGKHVLDFSKRANIAEFVVLCTLSGISERAGERLGELS